MSGLNFLLWIIGIGVAIFIIIVVVTITFGLYKANKMRKSSMNDYLTEAKKRRNEILERRNQQ